MLTLLLGCVPVMPEVEEPTSSAGIETGVTPRDRDTGEDILPTCPLAGSWQVARVTWTTSGGDFVDIDVTGSVEATGSPDVCILSFDVVVNDIFSTDCAFVEQVELRDPFGDLWEGFSDGGLSPPCRDSGLGPRSLGLVEVHVDENRATLAIDGNIVPTGSYLQMVASLADQTVMLTR